MGDITGISVSCTTLCVTEMMMMGSSGVVAIKGVDVSEIVGVGGSHCGDRGDKRDG